MSNQLAAAPALPNCKNRVFSRRFRDPVRAPKNENRVPRIRENFVYVIECETHLII